MNIPEKCIPCSQAKNKLSLPEIAEYLKDIPLWQNIRPWNTVYEYFLERKIDLVSFEYVIELVNRLAVLARNEGHHPDLLIHYNTLTINLKTFSVKGLTINDIILARKIDEIVKAYI